MNFRYRADGAINVALDETTTLADVEAIVKAFATGTGANGSFDPFRPKTWSSIIRAPWRARLRS